MQKINNLIDYISERIESGTTQAVIVSNAFDERFVAAIIPEDMEFFFKVKWKPASAGDVLIIRDTDSYAVISNDSFVEKYYKVQMPDLLMIKEIKKMLKLRSSADSIYEKSPTKRYRHQREVETVQKLKDLLREGGLTIDEALSYQAIIQAREKGVELDFMAISNDCAAKAPAALYAEGIKFALLQSFVEENFEEEKELDVDDIIRNDMDNLLIFLAADRDFVLDTVCNMQLKELIELSRSVDTMSVEELISFKSRVQGLSMSGRVSMGNLSKFAASLSSVEKITEQMKQEVYERKDTYNLKENEDIYSDIVK